MSSELPELTKIPEELLVTAAPGWGAEPKEDVQRARVGPLLLPQLFNLSIVNKEPTWMALLCYRVNADLEIGLEQVTSLGMEVPVALEAVTHYLSLEEWRGVAIAQVVLRDLREQLGNRSSAGSVSEVNDRRATHEWLMEHFGTGILLGAQINHAEALDLVNRVGEVSPTHRRTRVTSGHLRQVADVYRTADAAGKPPTRAVAEHFRASHSTAARWVSLARKRDFLPPTKPGKGRS